MGTSKVLRPAVNRAPDTFLPPFSRRIQVTDPEDVRFSVNFRVGSPDYYALLSGPAGRFRCAPFGIQQGDEAWQRTVSINAPELFLGHQ